MLNMPSASDAANSSNISMWLPEHVAAIVDHFAQSAPLIGSAEAAKIMPQLDLWDLWPVQLDDGSVAQIAGGELWMVLCAPCLSNPHDRHNVARTRFFHVVEGTWNDCGNLLPDGLNPGSREWSGSARYESGNAQLTVFFTAAGRAGEAGKSFEQRLFQCSGTLDMSQAMPTIKNWEHAIQSVENDGRHYIDLSKDQGIPGRIRGFRDPYWFRDPADGKGWLLFTGSLPNARSNYNGVVGIAEARDAGGVTGFDLRPPIINADGLANELERPHIFVRDGLYYLFWSSQRSIFAPDGPVGPTGLYGMVGKSLLGPYEPLNGTGLVIANPANEPTQAYCWQVLPTLEVVSFVDFWGLGGRDLANEPDLVRQQFGGTIAPKLKIAIDGNTTRLLGLA
jgi:levansucrase